MAISPQDDAARRPRRPGVPPLQGGRDGAGGAGAAPADRPRGAGRADRGARASAKRRRGPRPSRGARRRGAAAPRGSRGPATALALASFLLPACSLPLAATVLSLHPRRRPVPFRGRLLDPLRGGRLGGRRAPRRPHRHQRRRHRLGPRHPLRIHPQPGDRRRRSTASSTCAPSSTASPTTGSSRSARTPRSRRCIAHWNRMVDVSYENRSGIIHVRATAFTPRTPGRSPRRSSRSRARW